ncbi:MAG: Asp-tRNA(Asn)/Glu-tRNA(Gln) amidotransferase subunit GatC [Proteobacteria bacterium]|nr:Asp-tRNA(Asn)/Glu-tRNA(Gln) amidotransferase subunit GatC [Pseudomonadota bacterium]
MFTVNDIEKLSELVKISVSEEEKSKLAGMLSQTAEYMDMLNELDTSQVEPTYQVTGLLNVYQTDDLNKTLNRSDVLKNSKISKDGMIQTSAVLERE